MDIPVSRGTIYSNAEQGTILATSVSLNNLAIDPSIDGDKGALSIFLRDIVYRELCHLRSQKQCYENILRFVKKLEIPDFDYEQKYIKQLILEHIKKRLLQDKVTFVPLAEELEQSQIEQVAKANISGVYAKE